MITAVALVVLLTAKFRVPAFFALTLACFFMGLAAGLPLPDLLMTMKEGFGNIMKSLGFVIVLGTTLGAILENNGSIAVMSGYILRKLGEARLSLSMNLIGFLVGIPVFCDSGYIVLSGLGKVLSRRSSVAPLVLSVSMATGLYAVHCMIPPHPGATAAASLLKVDLGRLLLAGFLIAVPASFAGYLWSRYAGKSIHGTNLEEIEAISENQNIPKLWQSVLPILLPVMLMGSKSLLTLVNIQSHFLVFFISSLGDPVMALLVGIAAALVIWKSIKIQKLSLLLSQSAERAGAILVIIGAGGAFGNVLNGLQLGGQLGLHLPLARLGIAFPFLAASLLKTAQGSSTVAIITAASLVQPLLPALGLDSENGRLLSVLSMGAGSMMLSHGNDAYFWVIARFSSLEMKPMLKVYTVATLWMGLVSFGFVCILSLFLTH